MIGYITGTILAIDDITITILPQGSGIGYDILISPETLSSIATHTTTSLWIYHHKTEASEVLFGFLSVTERALFRDLLRVSGIGGKTALALLWIGSETLRHAIITEDVTLLSKAPGIGKKTAQKIILELRGSLTAPQSSSLPDHGSTETDTVLISSLVSMGYDKTRIESALREIDPELTLADRTRAVIVRLSQ